MTAAQLWPQGHQNHLITIGASRQLQAMPSASSEVQAKDLKLLFLESGDSPTEPGRPRGMPAPSPGEPSWRLQDVTLNGQRMGLVSTWGAGTSGTCHPMLRTPGHHC